MVMPFVSFAHTANIDTNIFSQYHRITPLIVLHETYGKFNMRGEYIYSETCFVDLINAHIVEDVIRGYFQSDGG